MSLKWLRGIDKPEWLNLAMQPAGGSYVNYTYDLRNSLHRDPFGYYF
jgi:hypothetical protein